MPRGRLLGAFLALILLAGGVVWALSSGSSTTNNLVRLVIAHPSVRDIQHLVVTIVNDSNRPVDGNACVYTEPGPDAQWPPPGPGIVGVCLTDLVVGPHSQQVDDNVMGSARVGPNTVVWPYPEGPHERQDAFTASAQFQLLGRGSRQ